MKWTVLVDNRTNDPALETEHGLSIFLETERHHILLDTGASDMLIRNAERIFICPLAYLFLELHLIILYIHGYAACPIS